MIYDIIISYVLYTVRRWTSSKFLINVRDKALDTRDRRLQTQDTRRRAKDRGRKTEEGEQVIRTAGYQVKEQKADEGNHGFHGFHG